MIIYYIGLTISAIFSLLGFIFLLLGIYFDFDSNNSEKLLPSLRVSLRYHLGCALAFGFALFTFLTTTVGFSWDSVCGSTVLIFVMSFLIILNKYIRLKTRNYLYKQGVSFSSLWNQEQDKVNKRNQ